MKRSLCWGRAAGEKVSEEESDGYLALVMLFLAATSLAVSGSGSDVGMGEFCRRERPSLARESVQQVSAQVVVERRDGWGVGEAHQEVWHRTLFSCQLEGKVGHLVDVWSLILVWFEHVSW